MSSGKHYVHFSLMKKESVFIDNSEDACWVVPNEYS